MALWPLIQAIAILLVGRQMILVGRKMFHSRYQTKCESLEKFRLERGLPTAWMPFECHYFLDNRDIKIQHSSQLSTETSKSLAETVADAIADENS